MPVCPSVTVTRVDRSKTVEVSRYYAIMLRTVAPSTIHPGILTGAPAWAGASNKVALDWIEQCFTSPPTQYRL